MGLTVASDEVAVQVLPFRPRGTVEQLALPGLAADVPAPARVPSRPRWRRRALPQSTAFHLDRSAGKWDAGQPLRAEDSVSGRVDQFSPKHLDPDRWARIGPIVRQWVKEAGPSRPALAATWMNVLTQHLAFCDAEGLPLTAEMVFRPDVVEHFIAQGCSHLSTGTMANYRSQLRTIGELVLGPEACPNRTVQIRASDPAPPYSAAEVGSLIGWGNGLPTSHQRHNTSVLFVLGLGAGLTSTDIALVVGTDVQVDGHGALIHVPGPNARAVPVLRRWEDRLAELAALTGDRPLFRSARERVHRKDISRFVDALRVSDAPKLSAQRLRITWIVHHLAAGTPVPALLMAAGISAKQLARYYPFVPAPGTVECRSLLREAKWP